MATLFFVEVLDVATAERSFVSVQDTDTVAEGALMAATLKASGLKPIRVVRDQSQPIESVSLGEMLLGFRPVAAHLR